MSRFLLICINPILTGFFLEQVLTGGGGGGQFEFIIGYVSLTNAQFQLILDKLIVNQNHSFEL